MKVKIPITQEDLKKLAPEALALVLKFTAPSKRKKPAQFFLLAIRDKSITNKTSTTTTLELLRCGGVGVTGPNVNIQEYSKLLAYVRTTLNSNYQ